MVESSYSKDELKEFLLSSQPYSLPRSFPTSDVRSTPLPAVNLEEQYTTFYPTLFPASIENDLSEKDIRSVVFQVRARKACSVDFQQPYFGSSGKRSSHRTIARIYLQQIQLYAGCAHADHVAGHARLASPCFSSSEKSICSETPPFFNRPRICVYC